MISRVSQKRAGNKVGTCSTVVKAGWSRKSSEVCSAIACPTNVCVKSSMPNFSKIARVVICERSVPCQVLSSSCMHGR
jgi:hypothetical protein